MSRAALWSLGETQETLSLVVMTINIQTGGVGEQEGGCKGWHRQEDKDTDSGGQVSVSTVVRRLSKKGWLTVSNASLTEASVWVRHTWPPLWKCCIFYLFVCLYCETRRSQVRSKWMWLWWQQTITSCYEAEVGCNVDSNHTLCDWRMWSMIMYLGLQSPICFEMYHTLCSRSTAWWLSFCCCHLFSLFKLHKCFRHFLSNFT